MARPSAVTPAIAALLEANREPGISPRALHARIGGVVSLRTLYRYLKRQPTSSIADRAARLAGSAAPDVADAPAALESDDLGRLVRVRDDLDAALDRWRLSLGADSGSVRAYAALARIHADVTARLVELRPRPEVEAERLEALGTKAREALVGRARENAAADEDLRGRVRRQQEVIDKLIDEGAD